MPHNVGRGSSHSDWGWRARRREEQVRKARPVAAVQGGAGRGRAGQGQGRAGQGRAGKGGAHSGALRLSLCRHWLQRRGRAGWQRALSSISRCEHHRFVSLEACCYVSG